MSILAFGLLMVGLTGSAFAEKHQSKTAREKAAKKACAMGDAQKGADILTDLLIEYNDSNLIYNQARCYQQNNLFAQAISRFREYLRKAKDLSESDRAETERQIADCEQSLGTASPTTPPAASATYPVPVTRPEPATESVAAKVAPSNPEPSPAHDKQGRGLRVAGIVAVAVGVAAVGTGVGLALKSQSLSTKDYSQSRENERSSLKTWGYVSYGVGAAAIATGAILYLVGWPSDSPSSSGVAFLPVAAPDGASMLLSGRF
jgi:tetratricopeptide (TPR) repeat protein